MATVTKDFAPPKQRHVADGTRFPCEGLSVTRISVMAIGALALVFVNKLGAIGNGIFFTVVVLMILAGHPQTALAGITTAILALCANTAFVEKTIIWTFARFINLFTFSSRFALASGVGFGWMTTPEYLSLTTFVVAAAICSLLSGYFVHIALLKLRSFWVGMTGFFACMHSIRQRRIDTTEWFVAQAVAVCGLCLASLILGVSTNFKEHATAGNLHNLGFYHSQTMGPFGALLVLYLLCVFLFAGHRNRWLCTPLILFLLYCIKLSGSRTGLGTLLFGIVVLLSCAFLWHRRGLERLRINLSRKTLAVLLIVATFLFIAYEVKPGGGLSKTIKGFVAKKSTEVESITVEDVTSSRAGAIAHSLSNFRQSPVFGIGFQVATTDYFRQNASVFYAPVEKGFLPTALLEEVGLVGTFFFLVFIFAMLGRLFHDRNVPGFTLFASLLISNLGEASLFALAGHGAYGWLIVVGAILLGDRCFVARRFGSANLGARLQTGPLQAHLAPLNAPRPNHTLKTYGQ
jgi:hypothetical protein